MGVPVDAEPLLRLIESLVRSALVPYPVVVDTAVEWLDAADVAPWVNGCQDQTAERLTRQAVAAQVRREQRWGEAPTDVDRLLEAFEALEHDGFCVFEDIGPNRAEGRLEVRQAVLRERDALRTRGFVFYGLEELRRAQEAGVLVLGTGGWGFTAEGVVRIALLAVLQEQGFAAEDRGEGAVAVPLDWHRRGWATGELGP